MLDSTLYLKNLFRCRVRGNSKLQPLHLDQTRINIEFLYLIFIESVDLIDIMS